MPKAFTDCVTGGGRVRTRSLSDGRYIRICYRGGKSYAGEVKTPKKATLRQHLREAAKEYER